MPKLSRVIPGKLKLFAVLGYPLKHSLSPVMHEAGFERLKLFSHRYLALELNPNSFKKFINSKKSLLLDGFNLTIPHKQTVIAYLDKITPEAKMIGAVNVVFRRGKRWVGDNTDAYGFIKSLRMEVNWRSKGKTALIFGAGGAARACVQALCKDRIRQIIILNRTFSKAHELTIFFRKNFPKIKFQALPLKAGKTRQLLKDADLVVNTTSLGLKKSDAAVLEIKDFLQPRAIKGKGIAVDLIYNPSVTPFLRNARRAGWKAVNGAGMLLYQGAKSFELWTGKKAPVKEMKKALQSALKDLT